MSERAAADEPDYHGTRPSQVRAARSILGWTQEQAAEKAGLTAGTVKAIENGTSSAKPKTITALRVALEAAGVQFLADGEYANGGAGVRLKQA